MKIWVDHYFLPIFKRKSRRGNRTALHFSRFSLFSRKKRQFLRFQLREFSNKRILEKRSFQGKNGPLEFSSFWKKDPLESFSALSIHENAAFYPSGHALQESVSTVSIGSAHAYQPTAHASPDSQGSKSQTTLEIFFQFEPWFQYCS